MKNSPFDLKIQNSMNYNQINGNSSKDMIIKSGISITKTAYKEYPSNIPND